MTDIFSEAFYYVYSSVASAYSGPSPLFTNNSANGPGNNSGDSDPVNGLSGQFYYAITDLTVPARGIDFSVSRLHQTQQLMNSGMPAVWQWNVVQWLDYSSSKKAVKYTYPDGRWVEFTSTDGKSFTTGPKFGDITDKLVLNADGTFELITPQQMRTKFVKFKSHQDETFYLISSLSDTNGNTLTWTYDSSFRITSITDGPGRALTFNMDPLTLITSSSSTAPPVMQVRIYSISDWSGRSWTYGQYIDFPGIGSAPQKFTTPENQTMTYSYSPTGRLTSVVDPRGNTVIANQYDSTNVRVVHQTRSNGDTFDYTYTKDAAGRPAAVVTRGQNGTPQGTTVTIYDKTTGARLEYINAVGHTTTFTSDPATGRPLSRSDPLGNTWKYTWDAAGNLTNVEDPLQARWSMRYDTQFNLPTQIVSPSGRTWKYDLDEHGNITGVEDPLAHTTTYERDSHGQIVSITNSLGKTRTLSYNSFGALVSLTDELGQTTSVVVDAVGRATAITDPLGHSTSKLYDREDRVISSIDGVGDISKFLWDATDNLVSLTDPLGRTTVRDYSSSNQLTTSVNPMGGTWRFFYNGRDLLNRVNNARGVNSLNLTNNLVDQLTQESAVGDNTNIVYDGADRLQQVTKPDGSTAKYSLDPAGRPLSVTYSDGTVMSYVYDADGRRIKMVDGIGTTTYAYDLSNRLTSVIQYNKVIRYEYDALDRLVTRIDANGVPTAFTYDDTGRLTSATRQAQSVRYVYDAAGRLTQKIQPNGNVCTYRYDDANRLLSLQWMNGTRPLHGNTYSYDANSNRITSTEITESGARFWAYRYDSLNQLTHAVLNKRFQLEYQYDAVGNLTRRTISRLHGKDEDKEDDGDVDFVDVTLIEKLGHNTDFACNDKDQVTSSGDISYSWDRNGNLISKTEGGKTTTYTWNARGLLEKVQFHDGQSEEFSYNGDGLMVRKTSRDRQSVTYVWTGAEVLNEYDNKGRTKAS